MVMESHGKVMEFHFKGFVGTLKFEPRTFSIVGEHITAKPPSCYYDWSLACCDMTALLGPGTVAQRLAYWAPNLWTWVQSPVLPCQMEVSFWPQVPFASLQWSLPVY